MIIATNELPDNCKECRFLLSSIEEDDEFRYCAANDGIIMDRGENEDERDPDCPLKLCPGTCFVGYVDTSDIYNESSKHIVARNWKKIKEKNEFF